MGILQGQTPHNPIPAKKINKNINLCYDANGHLIIIIITTTTTDPLGQVTRYDYDALDRVVKTTDPHGNAISYSFDANGNRLSLTDPKGNTTTYT